VLVAYTIRAFATLSRSLLFRCCLLVLQPAFSTLLGGEIWWPI